ncbi:hypothetical protein BKA69DRAFT_1032530 [Paraphysoderma sedebokerense]|nr:hypothetical protein BKA69DRAFT_1128621 [Paraphysoderma sedebokerense]KAI9137541.1 hypothetical protein BKA69DRAFT_1128148 [Paraphysoderma sedebokerense]KAI9137545.1 hypothetical protein BKA69DRAFT_1032530 [Paraphysoderma sedebokerense]
MTSIQKRSLSGEYDSTARLPSKRTKTEDTKLDIPSSFPSPTTKNESIDFDNGIQLQNKSIIREQDLDLVYYNSFLSPATATAFYNYCLAELPWHRVTYRSRGRQIVTPRYTTVFGIDETNSPPSVYKIEPVPIPDVLRKYKEKVEEVTGDKFNFVLINFYEDGSNSIAYHSDDESFLGPNPTIASLSLGGTRDFFLRQKSNHGRKKSFTLQNGDLIIMQGPTQSNWDHSIPKRSKAFPRVNITLRKAINVAGTNNYYRYNVGDGDVFKYQNGKMVPANALDTETKTVKSEDGDVGVKEE